MALCPEARTRAPGAASAAWPSTAATTTAARLGATLEPPRFCVHCRRRMKVQVTPGAWVATCVAHGSVEQSTWA